ncbi:MAG: phosphate acetyltransferase [Anaerococcus sp.]
MAESKLGVMELAIQNIKGKDYRIVFPEGEDRRVLRALVRHQEDGLIRPIILGDPEKIEKLAIKEQVSIEGLEIINPKKSELLDELVDKYVELRKGKNTREDGEYLLRTDPNYFGTMLIQTGRADGMLSGATNPTGDTVRPALQLIKTRPGVKRVSGVMIMLGPEGQKYLFADTAINITLEANELAEVAVQSAKTAEEFGIDPVVGMLSFSTVGSAKSPLAHKVALATKLAKEMDPKLIIDGEMQFDAAIAPEVAEKKYPESKVAGKVRVFIFPDLQAANIGYKIGQRLGHFQAIGPILQGLNKPVNDLSRGCNEEDVYKLAVLTANQVRK